MARTNHNNDNIERSKDRIKSTGEVFTPVELVDEILDKLPPELFTDPTKTFIDPAAGNGNFVVRVILRKLAYNSTVYDAVRTTYAVELMQDNVDLMHERIHELCMKFDDDISSPEQSEKYYGELIRYNYRCADSLKFDYDSWQPFGDVPAEDVTEDVTEEDDNLLVW